MKAFRVAADSSCLIGLAKINLFQLLNKLFSEVYITDAVYDEVVIRGKGEAGSEETAAAVEDGLIHKQLVKDELAVNALTTILGQGEAEVIILCKELTLDFALIDERTARDMAELMNVKTMGVLGIIDLAIEMGHPLDKKRLVDQLKETGFRISDKLYKRFISED